MPVIGHLNTAARRQQGIALITAVIMLMVITVLALAGARIALDTKRSTRNQRDFEIAFQAAQAALRDAETDISYATGKNNRTWLFQPDSSTGFVAGVCGTSTDKATPYLGLCDNGDTTKNIWDIVDWTATIGPQTVEYGTFTGNNFPTGSGLTPARKPRYLIELLPDRSNGEDATVGAGQTSAFIYRVTAVGFGPNDTTRAMVQMYYRKPKANS